MIDEIANEYKIKLINVNEFTNILLEDGIHINKNAHQLIYNKLCGMV